ncbi:MAG TPA: MOSC domain-containing protein [Spirochaetia bacterium]|nr:MOSC domain-containing protein [Spirochaetia bacterium]
MKKPFRILSLNVSERTGEQKHPVPKVALKEGHGILGDAHAGPWHRQISLLANEEINTMRGKGIEIGFGDFAENITTEGVDLASLSVGTRFYLGETELEMTQIGKECHLGCAIYQAVGDCVMPRKGVFARVLRGGEIDCASECYYDL